MQCAKSLILSGKSCGTHRRAPFDRKPGRGRGGECDWPPKRIHLTLSATERSGAALGFDDLADGR
jgi:hypothetical protein